MTASIERGRPPVTEAIRCASRHRVSWWRKRVQCRSFEGHPGDHWAGEWPAGKPPEIEWTK